MIPSTAMTDAQRKLLFSQIEKEGIDKAALEDRLGFSIGDLSKQEASVLIDCIMHDGDLEEAIEKILNYRVDNRAGSSSQGSKKPTDAPAVPAPKVTEVQSFGVVQIGDMIISEQDIDQLSKIPRMLNRIYQNVMQEGTDYGVIPGAGDKPTLLKPGAEMLRMAFNLRYKTEIDTMVEDWDKGLFYYRIKTHFFNSKDQYIGTGIGSANSEESRYSNRWVFESDIPEGIDKASLKTQERTSKKGSKYKVYLIEADIHEKATLVNTLQKMAKKRSFVDGILSITGASRIFTQDVEDMAGDRA